MLVTAALAPDFEPVPSLDRTRRHGIVVDFGIDTIGPGWGGVGPEGENLAWDPQHKTAERDAGEPENEGSPQQQTLTPMQGRSLQPGLCQRRHQGVQGHRLRRWMMRHRPLYRWQIMAQIKGCPKGRGDGSPYRRRGMGQCIEDGSPSVTAGTLTRMRRRCQQPLLLLLVIAWENRNQKLSHHGKLSPGESW